MVKARVKADPAGEAAAGPPLAAAPAPGEDRVSVRKLQFSTRMRLLGL